MLEARRTDEVADVLDAAESASLRGLWVGGYVAYEAAPGLDPALAVRARDRSDPFADLPLAWFAMFEGKEDSALPEPRDDATEPHDSWRPTTTRERYDGAIERIREHIAGGETYQINHTIRLRSSIGGDERGFYRDLCFAQRGGYAAYLNLGRYRVLSASPELFFQIEGGRITTRPMKGTAPRGRWPDEDAEVAERLRSSAKERAENAMIVDLLRNDLGRLGRPGTVAWEDVFEAERFETVWQLTTSIGAELSSGTSLADVFRALFPSGSVTGAPKVRSMGIIAELEDSPRGVYCGAVGILAPSSEEPASARFNVAIRTVVLDTDSHLAEYGVGGGITWDSRSASEYDEIVANTRVLTARRPRFDLFETLLREPGRGYRRLDLHLDRLRASAAYFGFRLDEAAVTSALDAAAAQARDLPARVRLTVSRDGRAEATAVPIASSPEPVRLAIEDEPVDRADPFLFHKTTLRDRYELAAKRHPDADDVVLVNREGEVTETTIANIAVRIDGRWFTPALDAGLMPGVERRALLDEGTLTERSITVEGLRAAEEIAVLNSVSSWRRAVLYSEEEPSGNT